MAAAAPLLIITAVTAVASAGLTYAQGKAEQDEAKLAVEGEREAARDRTDQRLQQVRALRSAQRTATAGSGLSLASGSVAAIDRDLDSQLRAEEGADSYQTKSRIASLKAYGTNARRAAAIGAGLSLLEGAAESYGTYRRMRPPAQR